MDLIEMVLVHPQAGLLCGAALPGLFFVRQMYFVLKNMHFDNCAIIFLQNDTGTFAKL